MIIKSISRPFSSVASGAIVLIALTWGWVACAPAEESLSRSVSSSEIDPAAAPGAFAPSLAVQGEDLLLTWIEPKNLESGEAGHELLFSRLSEGSWSDPVMISSGSDFFANWADFPAVAVSGDGSLIAHWLAMSGEETYAYSIFLARSTDDGSTWNPIGILHDDASPTEHGFVSYVSEGEGLRAFWLDGRNMVREGPMSLRTALIHDEIGPSEVVDDRTCDCCSTDAVATERGPLVVYRDRSEQEIRDIMSARRSEAGWEADRLVAGDGWNINGCPVNGPEIDADGSRVVVAWFTGAESELIVKAAFSNDSGESFSEAVVVDERKPLGRVDLVLDDQGGAIVSWLADEGEEGQVSLRRVSSDGSLGEVWVAGHTAATRSAGSPRMARIGKQVYVAWVEVAGDTPARVRARQVSLAEIPGP